MGSFVSAPPRTVVHVAVSVYGSLTGPISSPRTRLWILLEDGDPARPFARTAVNDPKTGQVVYRDLGPVASARVGGKRVELTVGEATYVLVEAPCVCGAGAAGMAGPVTGRYDLVKVRTDELEWLTAV